VAPAVGTGRWLAAGRELLAARELTLNLVRRDLKVRHRGTFLGMLWSLTTPLLIVGLYYFIFTFILRTSPAVDHPRPDGQNVPFAVYFFCGLTLWNLFANSVGASTDSVVGAAYLLHKVYFPRAILPMATVGSATVTFAFELSVLVVITTLTVGLPSLHILWVPLIVVIVVVLAFGLSLLLSAVTVFLRDVSHFVGVAMQLWFWGTPIIYSLQYVGDRGAFIKLLQLNPMTGCVVAFRNVVLLNRAPDYRLLAYDAVAAVIALGAGAWVFGRWQKVFSEVV